MRCDEAAEFASRLCDGQVISREAAEHIGTCEICRARLNEHAVIGAELRRAASLEQPIPLKAVPWGKRQRIRSHWWQEGRTTMRIPRFAFVSMLVLILVLSGGLVLVRARTSPGAGRSVLVLTFKLVPQDIARVPQGIARDCVITTDGNPKTGECSYSLGLNDRVLGVLFRFVSRDGDRTQVAVQAEYKEQSNTLNLLDDLKSFPERMIWVGPGRDSHIAISGLGEIDVTGQYLDHAPMIWERPSETLDPQKDEFRVVAPVLISGDEVLCDLSNNGLSISHGDANAALMIYCPGQGRYLISSVPFEGAVEASVKMGQIRFALGGQNYLLLSAMPIVREDHVWVSHDPNYKLSEHLEGGSDDRPWFMVRSLKMLLDPQLKNLE